MNNLMSSLPFAEAAVGFLFSCFSPVSLSNAWPQRTDRSSLEAHNFDLDKSEPCAGENRRGEGLFQGGGRRPDILQCY